MGENKAEGFGTVDFVVFIGSLVLSIAIGIYYAVVDRKKKSLDNYYFADNNMSPFPVAMSIAVTYISALTVIAFPTETYLYGFVAIWYSFVHIGPIIVACLYYIPLIHRWRLASIYEYIELRFNKRLRQLSSFVIIVNTIFYMGMTVYVPSLALNAVTPMSLNLSIIVTSLICTFYTTVGGMKAVIWTDTLQAGIMLAGSLAALVKCVLIVGGFDNVWAALERGGRLNALNFSLDPTKRLTAVNILIGFGIISASGRCCGQPVSQRYLSCKSVKHARTAALLSLTANLTFVGIAIFSGSAMYAYFEGCDPLTTKEIAKADQMIPYLVVKIFHDTPGVAGLFVAAAFSGTLSSVSSGINALASLVLEDFILTLKPKMTELVQLTVSKGLVMLLGLFVMTLALCIQFVSGTVLGISLALAGALRSPVLGIFTLGIFFPWTNSKGAFTGQVVATIISIWVAIGGIFFGDDLPQNEKLPTSIDKCYNNNTSQNMTYLETSTWFTSTETSSFTTSTIYDGPTLNNTVYAITHLYYSALALVLTVSIGLIASFITGAQDPAKMNPKYFMPIIENKRLPKRVRDFFRFGVPEYIEDKEENDFSKNSLLVKLEPKNSKHDEFHKI